MNERPSLAPGLDSAAFRSFYYLKEEMVAFCRDNGLPASGRKLDIADRIAHFLDTGEALQVVPVQKERASVDAIHEGMEIKPDFVCSEKHRAFFKEKIGKGFSFNVAFQKWLKTNTGKTYAEAVEAYHQLQAEKKNSPTTIDRQFEYNTYIRSFFADNQGLRLEDAIRCWKHKKSQPGHNRYEKADLVALAGE